MLGTKGHRLPRRWPAICAGLALLAAAGGVAVAATNGLVYVSKLGMSQPAAKANLLNQTRSRASLPESPTPAKPPPTVHDTTPAAVITNPQGPPMVGPETMTNITSAWTADDGSTGTTVYAGTNARNPSDGLLVIVRQDDTTGRTAQTVVPVAGSGAVRIVSGPTGAAVETSAQRTGVIEFRTASGSAGQLDLSTNAVP